MKVWRNKTKAALPDGTSAAVTSGTTEFVATDPTTTVYIEGFSKGVSTISLNWKSTPEAGGAAIEAKAIDKVKITVYEITGPLNVPGYARDTYKAEVPGAATPPGTWTAEGGTATAGAANECQILWGEGGKDVSYAIFKPNAQFQCKRDVNAVQVDLDIAGSSIDVRNPPVQTNGGIRIDSAAPAALETMSSPITVRKVQDPERDGIERGLRYIELGFIQVLKVTRWHGKYNFATFGAKESFPTIGGATFEGQEGLDGNTAGVWPWYDSKNLLTGAGFLSYAALYDLEAGEPRETNVPFRAQDTPKLDVVDALTLPYQVGPITKYADVNRFELRLDFQLFFAVRTFEASNDSETIYSQRAKALWHFDGSGSVTAGVWKPDSKTPNGSGKSFMAATPGAVVPYTAVGNPQANSFFNVFVQPIEGYAWRNGK